MLTSTLLTLVLIPAVYTIMDDFTSVLARAPRAVRLLVRMPRFEPEPPHIPAAEAPCTPERRRVPAAGGAD